MTNANYSSIRGVVIYIGVLLTLTFGILLMDKGLLTLSTFIIIYSNRYSIFDLVLGISYLGNSFVDI